jgi:phospholipid/cholesterol/gamma-HCH transport system permease protein
MIELMARLGRFTLFNATVFRATVTHRPPIGRVIEEAYNIGVKSLPILLIISTFVGTNLALQGYNAFSPLGGQKLVGMFVALAGVREMAPIMVAAMVASKAGTEMASQIAVMRIREQIDALDVMAINPHWFLVTPRFFGILLVIPALNVLSTCTLLASAYAVSTWQLGLSGHEFIALAASQIHLRDMLVTTLKSLCFGAVICLVSCYQGFTSAPGPNGVGSATNAAVVLSACIAAIINYLLTTVFYG